MGKAAADQSICKRLHCPQVKKEVSQYSSKPQMVLNQASNVGSGLG